MINEEKELWVCLIEADGAQLPSRFYRRRDSLALNVRGDKELGPLARRENGSAVIFQEGAIICSSESLARQMMWYARDAFDEMEERGQLIVEDSAGRTRVAQPTVSIGRLNLTQNVSRTGQDLEVIDRIERVLGRRGRKPAEVKWAVACTECVTVNEVQDWAVVNCPHCSGFLIHSRKGEVVTYKDPGGDPFAAWLRTRFAGPHWEPSPIDDSGQIPPAVDVPEGTREGDVVALMEDSDVLDQIRQMPRDVAFRFLDAIFIARAYRDLETRLDARARTATEFFKRGGAPTGIRLTEPKKPDLVDAALIMRRAPVVTWLLADGAGQKGDNST